MSKVVITGNASGTGDFTIAAPNSNTDRTLTLPDEAGTVLTNVSLITSAQLTGDAVPIGAGQTWQNVTRTTGTTYYNTTGRTICFSVSFSGANTFNLSVSTAGHLFLQGSAGTYKNLSVLIPAGERYIPTYSFTLYNMLELR